MMRQEVSMSASLCYRCCNKSKAIRMDQKTARIKMNVLVVGVPVAQQFVLRRSLEARKLQVTVVSKGQEALKKLNDNHYCLIVLNLRLPDMDIMCLLKKIQQPQKQRDGMQAHSPLVIGVSKAAQIPFWQQHMSAGVDCAYAMPLTVKSIGEIAGELIARHLTCVELEALNLYNQEYTEKKAAKKIGISEYEYMGHLERIREHFDVKTKNEMLFLEYAMGES